MIFPVNKIAISNDYHYGMCIDFGWWKEEYRGQPILACDNGKVISVEKQENGGNVVYIRHDNGIVSCYAHLDKVYAKKGNNIILGEYVGTMGSTGEAATGMHLHFGLYSKGKNMYGHTIQSQHIIVDVCPLVALSCLEDDGKRRMFLHNLLIIFLVFGDAIKHFVFIGNGKMLFGEDWIGIHNGQGFCPSGIEFFFPNSSP